MALCVDGGGGKRRAEECGKRGANRTIGAAEATAVAEAKKRKNESRELLWVQSYVIQMQAP